jgi:CIC family chloride channel protein
MTDGPRRLDATTASKPGRVKVAPVQPRPTVHTDEDAATPLALFELCFLAFAVGIVTGLGAVVFRGLIGLVHNVCFLGRFSFAYDASQFTPGAQWGVFVLLVPVVGGLAVTGS